MKIGSVLPAWVLVIVAVLVALGLYLASGSRQGAPRHAAATFERPEHAHLDHAPYFKEAFDSPQAVTRACLKCHPKAAEQMRRTPHWTWLGDSVAVPGHEGRFRLGKRNLMNNFCISVTGNNSSCMKCHAGYGWADDSFDFSKDENVDCLVCHERAGTYVKGEFGNPAKGADLLAAAKSVGFPKRENCGVCHNYGGGGQGVKHGDLDSRLDNPSREDDVHMGQLGFLCIDCHRSKEHRIAGRAFSVSVEDSNGVACTDCHREPPHRDPRINTHLASVACQTCHIGTYARSLPTKTFWDWSKAGDGTREDDPHRYLKIKGEFFYGRNLVPEYAWFDRTVNRYLVGDRIDSTKVTAINEPRGAIGEKNAKIWPFKVHRALLPYDREYATLMPPVTAGPGGYWHDFDWSKAIALGAKAAGLPYSGRFGWARTSMHWPLSHAVAPKEGALQCNDCHGPRTRMDWAALGYEGDPLLRGARR